MYFIQKKNKGNSNKINEKENDLLYNFMVEIMGIQGAPMEEPDLTLGNIAYDRTKDNSLTMHGERKIES